MAVVALNVRAGGAGTYAAFEERLRSGETLVAFGEARAGDFEVDLAGLRFPPADLVEAIPQQTWLLDAALSLLSMGRRKAKRFQERQASLNPPQS